MVLLHPFAASRWLTSSLLSAAFDSEIDCASSACVEEAILGRNGVHVACLEVVVTTRVEQVDKPVVVLGPV